ncbi:transposase, partial [Salmonella enterica]
MESQSWRKEPRKNYSNDFKLRMVELAFRPRACVAQIARENGINDNVIFKWLRLWQNEGRISRHLPSTVVTSSLPTILPVEVVPDPTPSGRINTEPAQFSALNASS